MKKLLLLIPLILSTCTMHPVFAQTVVIQRPDCQLLLGLITTAPTNVGPLDNRTTGCTFWAIAYNANGFSALSLLVQTAPDAGGVPGAWSTFTAATGANPNTTTTQNTATFGGATSYFPWLRVQLTSKTGTGSISGVLYGWKDPAPQTVSAVVVGTVTVVGNKSNNAVVPGATNLGVLPCVANAAAPTWTETFQVTCSVDLAGNQRVAAQGVVAAAAAAAGAKPVLVGGQDSSASAGNAQYLRLNPFGGILPSSSQVAAADGSSNTANAYEILNNSVFATGTGIQFGYGWHFNGTTWDRVRGNTNGTFVQGPAADGAAATGNPVRVAGKDASGNVQDLLTDTAGEISTIRSASGQDAFNNASSGLAVNQAGNSGAVQIFPYVYNGGTTTGWDRPRSASLTNLAVTTTLTGRNSIGAALSEKGSRWSVVSNPAASSQATASIAAEASVRHIVDCISFSASAGGAVTAANVNVNIRDGATGAGTIIWTFQLSSPTAAALGLQEVSPHSICGLNLVGTTNTAMTAEFSAGVTNLIEAVSVSGYNVN